MTNPQQISMLPWRRYGLNVPKLDATDFVNRVLAWFEQHGRNSLPWQQDPSPYRVWVSEIMLQQTQVQTVIPYFNCFTDKFPTLESLAKATEDEVLHLWTGLGYYARARNLLKAARQVSRDYQGRFPRDIQLLQELPGIGRSTAGAIASLSMDLRAPILDGNVKRVLTRCFAIAGWPEQGKINTGLWQLAEQLTPHRQVADYTQAMMDLGATVCISTNPHCTRCPLQNRCRARTQNEIELYPSRKPKKALPTKSVVMYILLNSTGSVLLEKRPPSGIWGSLYSLPEGQPQARVASLMNQHFPLTGARRLASVRHTFSHYHLDIIPLQLPEQDCLPSKTENGRWLWYPLDHSHAVGLAAPVKKLLSILDQNRNH
ncbi:MAG: A/G-specific adenine glycosylase [Gammaproteobacteria bacterium]|nr:A/G-specific adenine glycosylase [Gammaproteobacteria bacterium]